MSAGDKLTEARLAELEAEVQVLLRAVRFYADESNWINRLEFKAFPGFHGRATALRALEELGLIGGQVAS